ncbi:primase-helicase family protein [Mangrovimonas sp. TPBH4]|uniref:primase-helicase family protein n=1 Tax=Mangrovimonas sp. TPBH4 TaxID=1645914 RepID=UPI0006B3FDE2|nr:primase-helicase family protein [Mangrovimonas sp. TPBH4]
MTYIRIGTDYYKRAQVPLHSGDKLNTLLRWKKSEIILDEGKGYLDTIERYDGFCLIPSHTDYQESIDGFYNQYERLGYQLEKGAFSKTLLFLEHIFGEQIEIGLDYLTILWKYPSQVLPILCLVSEERKTGKTTFLNWLKLIFQGNMTINKNEDFRSRFNSDWSNKLIVAVDEVLLDKKEDSERIKNLSTAATYKTESKGVDKVESFFFGKFILCSNNETSFIQVDKDEIRYWVRKVPGLKDDNENPDLVSDLKREIPHFLFFLSKRKIKNKRKTRMWFTKEQIKTEALLNLVHGNKTSLDKELKEILVDDFIKFEVDLLKYSLGDLVEKLKDHNVRVSSFKVAEALKLNFNLFSKNGSFAKYHLVHQPKGGYLTEETKHKGRYYTFKKEDFI